MCVGVCIEYIYSRLYIYMCVYMFVCLLIYLKEKENCELMGRPLEGIKMVGCPFPVEINN